MQSPLHFPRRTLKPELLTENRLETQPTPPESGERAWALIQEQLPREARKDVLVMYLSKTPHPSTSTLKDLLLEAQISSSQDYSRGQALFRDPCPAFRMRKGSVQSRDTLRRLLQSCSLSSPPPPLGRGWAEPVTSQCTTYWETPRQEKLLLLEQIHICKCCNKYLFQANVFKNWLA